MTPRSIATISNALDAALVYFKDREDADHNGVDFVANEEMRLALEIEQAQAALEELRKSDSEETIMGEITCPR